MPVAQAFARHVEIVAHIWMKDKRQSHGTRRNDVVGEIRNSVTQVAVFVGLQKAWLLFRDRSDVGKLASFLGEGIASFIELLVQHGFDGGEFGYVIHKLFYTLT